MSVDWPRPGASEEDALMRWVRERLHEEVTRSTFRWFAARIGWPPWHLRRAYSREWQTIHQRAACATVKAAGDALSGPAADLVAARLRPRRDPPQVLSWLGMPGRVFGGCKCELPGHARGIARCEWNEIRGWRPREVELDAELDAQPEVQGND